MTVSSLATAGASFVAPMAVAGLAYVSAAPPGVKRPYGLLVVFGIVAGIFAILAERLVGMVVVGHLADQHLHLVADAFLRGSLPEETILLVMLFLWLALVRDRRPQDAITGAVGIAMAFNACENVLALQHTSDAQAWAHAAVIRTFIDTPSAAANAAVIGLWTALTIADRGRLAGRRIGGAFAVAVLVHGVWDTAALFIVAHKDTLSDWLSISKVFAPVLLGTVAAQSMSIMIALRHLKRHGVLLQRWHTT